MTLEILKAVTMIGMLVGFWGAFEFIWGVAYGERQRVLGGLLKVMMCIISYLMVLAFVYFKY